MQIGLWDPGQSYEAGHSCFACYPGDSEVTYTTSQKRLLLGSSILPIIKVQQPSTSRTGFSQNEDKEPTNKGLGPFLAGKTSFQLCYAKLEMFKARLKLVVVSTC